MGGFCCSKDENERDFFPALSGVIKAELQTAIWFRQPTDKNREN